MRFFRKSASSAIGLCLLCLTAISCSVGESELRSVTYEKVSAPASWKMSGQNLHNTRHQSAETIIDPSSAKRLTVKWSRQLDGNIFATPAVEDGVLYIPDNDGKLYKIDAETGDTIWKRRISDYGGLTGALTRTTPAVTADSLIFGSRLPGGNFFSVDKVEGEEVFWKRRLGSRRRAALITQSAVVHNQTVYVGVSSGEETLAQSDSYSCCKFRGSMVAIDQRTGDLLQQTFTVPEGYSGGAVWGSTAVVDVERNSLYFTTGNNYSIPPNAADCLNECLGRKCDTEQITACLTQDPGNHFDSIVAVDLTTLENKWARPSIPYDAWTRACRSSPARNCPEPPGPDFDFAQGPVLFTAPNGRQLLGAGQKSGTYWAVDPATGEVVWKTEVGPGAESGGGSMWGSATDGERVYVAIGNGNQKPWKLKGSGQHAGETVTRGFWSALDAATGAILWQTPEYHQPPPEQHLGPQGAVSSANGVVFGGTTTPGGDDMLALDAATGKVLWKFTTGGTVNAGPAVVDGVVYWGALSPSTKGPSDYSGEPGSTDSEDLATLYAFTPGPPDTKTPEAQP